VGECAGDFSHRPTTAEGENVKGASHGIAPDRERVHAAWISCFWREHVETSSGSPVAGISQVLNDQLPKVSARIARALEAFEKAFGRGDTSMRRLASAAPTSPATLSPEQGDVLSSQADEFEERHR
jgi:hypothetical protein